MTHDWNRDFGGNVTALLPETMERLKLAPKTRRDYIFSVIESLINNEHCNDKAVVGYLYQRVLVFSHKEAWWWLEEYKKEKKC